MPKVIAPTTRPQRSLWLRKGFVPWLDPPGKRNSDGVAETALSYAKAVLNSFVAGDELEEGFDLTHLNPRMKEVWELRTVIAPQLRLFGWFAQPNHFIVVHGKTRDFLGSDASRWDKAREAVVDDRNALFPGQVLYHGVSYDDYVN